MKSFAAVPAYQSANNFARALRVFRLRACARIMASHCKCILLAFFCYTFVFACCARSATHCVLRSIGPRALRYSFWCAALCCIARARYAAEVRTAQMQPSPRSLLPPPSPRTLPTLAAQPPPPMVQLPFPRTQFAAHWGWERPHGSMQPVSVGWRRKSKRSANDKWAKISNLPRCAAMILSPAPFNVVETRHRAV